METFSALPTLRDENLPEQTVEQTIKTPMIWDALALIITSL